MLAKAKLAVAILATIERRGLNQTAAAKLLGTDPAYLSRLKSGHSLRRFTFDRLMDWLTKLDQNIILTIKNKPKKQEEGMILVAG